MILQYVGGVADSTSLFVREGILLSGSYNGSNRVFTLPEAAINDPPKRQIKVYHGGRRLQPVEYEVLESFPGSGYDTIKLVFAPQTMGKLYADYYAVAV